jgi:exo-beta-1,3-glucanase (GH17 family)
VSKSDSIAQIEIEKTPKEANMNKLLGFVVMLTIALCIAGCSSNKPISLTKIQMGKVSVRMTAPANMSRNSVTEISVVTITVIGPEISAPITKPLVYDSISNSWNLTLDVPSGIKRVFTVEAYNASNQKLFSGSNESDVAANAITNVRIELYVDSTAAGVVRMTIGFDNPYLGIGKVPSCIGHAFKVGQSPSTEIPESQIAEIYAYANGKISIARTYSTTHGNQYAAKYCAQYGIPLWLGVNFSDDAVETQKEVNSAISIAGQYPLAGIVAGNEYFLGETKDEAKLIACINQLKAALPNIPIAYAETSDIWKNNGAGKQQLAASVDVVMAHPWAHWNGIDAKEAVKFMANEYAALKNIYPGKRIILGEVGWASEGPKYINAEPSLLNQRLVIDEFVPWAKANNVEYMIFSLIDEPWKTEGGVGSHWGMCYYNSTTGLITPKSGINQIWF